MKCPECDYNDSKVIDSRPAENKIRRRRECLLCSHRFTTYEVVEDVPVMVQKKDGTIEPFNPEKLAERIRRATAKRPVKFKTIENMVENIHAHFKNALQREVPSAKIGDMVLEKLEATDHVAYVRFASVYQEFNDVESFINFINAANRKKSNSSDSSDNAEKSDNSDKSK